MPPFVAAVCVVSLMVALFRADRDRNRVHSAALYLPLAWLVIGGTRPLSDWFSLPHADTSADGSPFDRMVLSALIAVALYVLSKGARRAQTIAILRANPQVIAFLLYCLMSVIWADDSFVAFKRWIRGAADIAMVLVILTDSKREAAVTWVLGRIAFLLIPLSILIIRYFPAIGRAYSPSGAPMWTGVCCDKNALGAVCMIFGTSLFWRLLNKYSIEGTVEPDRRQWKKQLYAMVIVSAMTLYLVKVIDSQTALVCFVLANTLIVLVHVGGIFRNKMVLNLIVAAMVLSCYCVLFLGIGGGALHTIGRNSTLTGRTEIWTAALPLVDNPLIGTGYESFWMGERLMAVHRALGAYLNQVHNGYYEIYLDLGWIGLFFLTIVVFAGYRNIMAVFSANRVIGSLKLAFFVVCLVYNFTEACFKMMSPIWIVFLWATMAVPKRPSVKLQRVEDTAHASEWKFNSSYQEWQGAPAGFIEMPAGRRA